MKAYNQYDNQQNNAKKARKHYSKQAIRKAWKTPSPSLHSDLKSPRFIRNKQKHAGKTQQNSEINIQNEYQSCYLSPQSNLSNTGKSDNHKQIVSDTENRVQKYYTKVGKKNMLPQQIKINKEYFTNADNYKKKSTTAYQHQSNLNTGNDNSLHETNGMNLQRYNPNRNISQSDNQSVKSYCSSKSKLQLGIQGPKKYQQTIRKYQNENQKLKKQNKELSEKYINSQQDKNEIQKQCDNWKKYVKQLEKRHRNLQQKMKMIQKNNIKQIEDLSQMLKTASQKEFQLTSNIKKLQYHINKNSRQLESNNLVIYKMKQQAFQFQAIRNKLNSDLRTAQITIEKLKNQNKRNMLKKSETISSNQGIFQETKTITANSTTQTVNKSNYSLQQKICTEKTLESERNIQKLRNRQSSKSIEESKPTSISDIQCKQCESKTKIIIQNEQTIQKQMFQLMKKQNIITNMWTQLKKVEGQVRMLDKPKNMYKKLNGVITQLNEQITKSKINQLNMKYSSVYPGRLSNPGSVISVRRSGFLSGDQM